MSLLCVRRLTVDDYRIDMPAVGSDVVGKGNHAHCAGCSIVDRKPDGNRPKSFTFGHFYLIRSLRNHI